MKKLSIMICLACSLTGCPGLHHEGAEMGESRWISVDKERVCFSIDKNDVLTTYNLSSNEDGQKLIIASDTRKPTSYVYPNTCFSTQLKTGYIYYTLYMINNVSYHYEFFIDNNWNVVNLNKG